MFTKEERSSFPYWFAHWCAFNMTALNLKVWKFKYIFHDWYKPWLRLFLPYEKVQKFHREHSKHHLEWLYNHQTHEDAVRFDWDAMIIDWECSRFTKEASQLNAYWEWKKMVMNFQVLPTGHWIVYYVENYGRESLERLGLMEKDRM